MHRSALKNKMTKFVALRECADCLFLPFSLVSFLPPSPSPPSFFSFGSPPSPVPSLLPLPYLPGLISCRSQSVQENSSTNMGLEAIIRKALMGKYDEQWEERSPLSANAFNSLNASASLPAAMPITPADGRNEDVRSLPGLQPSPPSLSLCY